MAKSANTKRSDKPHLWAKGQSGNLSGRPKLPEHVLTLKRDASIQAQLDIIRAWQMTQSEMFAIEQDNTVPAGFKALVACLNNSIQVGSYKELSMFLDRIVGKVTEQIELSGPEGGAIETSANGTMNEILTLLKAKNEDGR